ncbi:MAG: helix-turn-helix transcriptional regulator [Oscillospiraceae bacterium]|nr:helix-turn-helix transcriptional regulator [Oscillospiraceae bacterium]
MKTIIEKPEWGRTALKALIDKDMTVSQLAAKIGFNRATVSAVIHGRTIRPDIKEAVIIFLEIENAA